MYKPDNTPAVHFQTIPLGHTIITITLRVGTIIATLVAKNILKTGILPNGFYSRGKRDKTARADSTITKNRS